MPAARTLRGTIRAAALSGVAALTAGSIGSCGAVGPKPSAPTAPMPADGEGAGVFTPVQMRIHPLTRVRREADGRPLVETHVELFDRWGHSVKGLGVVEFDFLPASAGLAGPPAPAGNDGGGGGDGRRTLEWTVDLTDPEVNSRGYFDYVTRTYLITLRLEEDTDLRRRSILRATFTTPSGRVMTADYEIIP